MWNEEEGGVLWARLPDEPELWFRRFESYCILGAERSLAQCYRLHAALRGRQPQETLPRAWRRASRRWGWRERAQAWDLAVLPSTVDPEAQRSAHARRRRLELLDRLIAQTAQAFDAAIRAEDDPARARKTLPTLRPLLRDLLAAERAEDPLVRRPRAGAAEPVAEGGGADPPVSDDDVARVAAQLVAYHEARDAAREAVREAARETGRGAARVAARAASRAASLTAARALAQESAQPALFDGDGATDATPEQRLVVCLGPDPALAYDLGMLRAVRTRSGLPLTRLTDCTRDALERVLRRDREHGHPVRWLHMACHAGHDGVALKDGVVDGEWLSARLDGVEVLLLAACRGDRIGDWLAVVPWVVTLHEPISHADAGTLARYFWQAMVDGATPDAALNLALRRCPPMVAEFVVRHW